MAREAVRVRPVKTPEPRRWARVSPAMVEAMLMRPPSHAQDWTEARRSWGGEGLAEDELGEEEAEEAGGVHEETGPERGGELFVELGVGSGLDGVGSPRQESEEGDEEAHGGLDAGFGDESRSGPESRDGWPLYWTRDENTPGSMR